MERGQVSLRRFLLAIAIAGVIFGSLLAFALKIVQADRDAVIQAIRAGRIDLESEREFLSEETYQRLRAEMRK